MKNLIKTRADVHNVNAAIFESMLNRTGMSAEDMKLVLENNNVHQSVNRIQHNRELVSMIDILLGGNLVFNCNLLKLCMLIKELHFVFQKLTMSSKLNR
jgi:hypothetical protein